VVIAHEVVHSINRSKEPRVIVKLDYENAYDKVNIDSMLEILKLRGFGDIWLGWIKNIVRGSISVLANGEESATFKTGKGLRQAGPSVPTALQFCGCCIK
jgi:hypothetical protein